MTPREERGLIIAAVCKLKNNDDEWLVPSQSSGEKTYRVNPTKQTCTCPDHAENGHKCKHLFAVEITMKREIASDGTVIETKSITFTEKKTYRQNWPSYNAAQSVEKDRVQQLLFELCKGIQEPERNKTGRRPHLAKDAIFASVFKVYSTFSARQFDSDLLRAHERGYLTKPVPSMKTTAFTEDSVFTPILKELVAQSATPLKAIETDFAIDSSGFATSRFERWYDQKYGVTRRKCLWVKTHIACGVKTNVVTAVRILDKDAGDSPQFVPLVTETSREFTIGEVSADKAYASLENFEAVAGFGGTLYATFKSSTTGAIGGLFEKMFHYFQFQQEEYMNHYHKRSNVESTFSMIKRKFGDSVRSKTDAATKNEVRCKLLCHNLVCLIHEQEELGISPIFWKNDACNVLDQPATH